MAVPFLVEESVSNVRVLVNASALASAGGRSVALNFLRAYAAGRWEDELLVCAPAGCGYESLAGGRIRLVPLPGILAKPSVRVMLDGWIRRTLVGRARADVVFNMGNFGLPIGLPQVTLFHWPYAIYPDSEVWQLMAWKDKARRKLRRSLFRHRLPFTSVVVAQTETAAKRLARFYSVKDVRVVPNAVSHQEAAGPVSPLPGLGKSEGRIRLLCFTKYYPHKNVEVMIPVAHRFRRMKAPFEIVLTIAPDQHANARKLLRRIRSERLEHYIHTIGPVAMQDVPRLYASVDALLLPTLLESFSQTYVEAMHFGRPIFTSDFDFAHDVCGDAALYFDPHDPDDIAQTITKAYEDRGELHACVERGRRRVAKMPDWPTVARMFVDILHEVAAGRPSCCERELIV